jgi:hypothetical protein
MNIALVLIIILLFIIVIYTLIDKYMSLSLLNDDNNDDKDDKNNKDNIYKNDNIYNEIIKDDKIFIKYSSIKNKLNTLEDYINLDYFIDDIKSSIYISEIMTNEKNRILELITTDMQKTKLKYNFNKLKNIFVIIKNIEDNIKIILFYDGLIYNSAHFEFIQNDYSGYTLVYKLDLRNKIFNHYLQ